MKHNRLSPRTTQELDDWGAPKTEVDMSDWNEWTSTPEAIVESPKRKGLVRRFGEKVTGMTRHNGTDGEIVEPVTQSVSAEEYRASHEAVEAAKTELQAARAELAKREEYFDSQQTARLPKPDGSGFSDPIAKSNLDSHQIKQAKYFDSQQQHFAVDRAQKVLDKMQGGMDDVNRRSWEATPMPSVDTSRDQTNSW